MKNCEIIQDLLPLYIDDVASKESRSMIEEHIKSCSDCRNMLSKMQSDGEEIKFKTETAEIGVLKMIKKKIMKTHVIVGIVSALLVIAAVISLATHAAGAKAIGFDFWIMGAIIAGLLFINAFFGMYNLKVTQRIKQLSGLQYAILLFLNVSNTGNCVIHLIINVILGAYKKS